MRGKRRAAYAAETDLGSIPACAGEAASTARPPPPGRVYPRVCGGSSVAIVLPLSLFGLSPRVRGKPAAAEVEAVEAGSIPACAGEARRLTRRPMPTAVYPRVCGGSDLNPQRVQAIQGLSPRVRGKPARSSGHYCRAGSIPACAGEAYRN